MFADEYRKMSDRFGRKPVLVLSLFGVAISTTLFGMSQNIWQMIVFRGVAGVFSGTIVTVRAMLSELSTKQTQARIFSIFSFAYNMGIFLGPLIGRLPLYGLRSWTNRWNRWWTRKSC